MGTRNAIAIDLGRRRLRAVQAGAVARRGVRVGRVVVADVPADLNLDDPAVTGSWLAERLAHAGFSRGPATISVGREHVILKRIILPTVDPAELPDMTRLAMQRELPFDAETAVIDFVAVERHEASTTVLAVAVPRKQIEFVQQVMAEAGLKVQRIALRTMGAAALVNLLVEPQTISVRVEDVEGVADESESVPAGAVERVKEAPATLAVDVVGEGVEFCVLSEGSIRFSRAAEVPAPQDALAMAEAVVTEARRTWMSYRSGDDSGGIGQAVIMGDRRVAEYAAGPVGEMLKMPVKVLREHPHVEIDERSGASGEGPPDLSRVWPLVGLLLESESSAERIDFLHPRKTPDVGARTRQRRLLAAAAAVVIGGVAFTLMRNDLQSLQGRANALVSKNKSDDAVYARSFRDAYKLAHIEQWQSVHVDWLDHAMFLAKVAPPPEQIVLDSWTGTLEFRGVNYERRSNRWSADHQATIVIDGEARNRATADAFRGALIQNPIYAASTTGADARGGKRMPFGFTYRLRTQTAAPAGAPAPATPVSDRKSTAASPSAPEPDQAVTSAETGEPVVEPQR